MKASIILDDLFSQNSPLDAYASLEQFSKMMPPECPNSLTQSVYEELRKQRHDTVIHEVIQNIKMQFQVPLSIQTVREKSTLPNIDASSVLTLNDRLSKIRLILNDEHTSLTSEISKLLSTNEEMIQLLSDLRYGRNPEQELEDTLHQKTIDTLFKLERLLE